jgi:hypothetical protein
MCCAEYKKCYRMECDALFTPRELRQRQKGWKREGAPQLAITAGPERSGSTWLYNAGRESLRLQLPLDSVEVLLKQHTS